MEKDLTLENENTDFVPTGNTTGIIRDTTKDQILIDSIDPNRLRKQLLKKVDEVKAAVKDNKPVSWSALNMIEELSYILHETIQARTASQTVEETVAANYADPIPGDPETIEAGDVGAGTEA